MVFEPVLLVLVNDPPWYAIEDLVGSVAGLAKDLNPNQAETALVSILSMVCDLDTLMKCAPLLVSLPAKLTAEQADVTFAPLFAALKTSSNTQGAVLAQMVGMLAPRFTNEQSHVALQWVRIGLGGAGNTENWARALLVFLARGNRGDELAEIVEALKYPTTALGGATDILLGRLRELYPDAPELQGSFGDAVRWLERQLGADVVTRSPARPGSPELALTSG